jgi:hypothetical protein
MFDMCHLVWHLPPSMKKRIQVIVGYVLPGVASASHNEESCVVHVGCDVFV